MLPVDVNRILEITYGGGPRRLLDFDQLLGDLFELDGREVSVEAIATSPWSPLLTVRGRLGGPVPILVVWAAAGIDVPPESVESCTDVWRVMVGGPEARGSFLIGPGGLDSAWVGEREITLDESGARRSPAVVICRADEEGRHEWIVIEVLDEPRVDFGPPKMG